MGFYSPIDATFGIRVAQILESDNDFIRYHLKLNKKLIKLRHILGIINKDTKNFKKGLLKIEKNEILSSKFYDNKNKLIGVYILLMIERDCSYVELLKLRGRARGKFYKNEKKLIMTRLKKVMKLNNLLVNEITVNEKNWITRLQYMIYSKIINVEYLLFGKKTKKKNSQLIAKELSFIFESLTLLKNKKLINGLAADEIQSKYNYYLKQHAGNIFSSAELNNFMVSTIVNIHSNKELNDEFTNILFANGYKPVLQKELSFKKDTNESTLIEKENEIKWIDFITKVDDEELFQLILDANNFNVKVIDDYDTLLIKWTDILQKQETNIVLKQQDEDNMETDILENEQILLAYIKYNLMLTSVCRDNMVLESLMKQWDMIKSNNSMATSKKLNKYKEIERIVKNLTKFIADLIELPGVFSSENLMNELELLKNYYQITLNSTCLSDLYQSKHEYLQALSLNVNSLTILENCLMELNGNDLNELIIPSELINSNKIANLRSSIKAAWNNIIALAEYDKAMEKNQDRWEVINNKSKVSIIETIDDGIKNIKPKDVKLNNLFPLRPIIRPVPAKPTLFDLAFNYIDYNNESTDTIEVQEDKQIQEQKPEQKTEEVDSKKKSGFLGLFGR